MKMLSSQGFYIFNLYVTFYGLIIASAMIVGIIVAYFICTKKNLNKDMPIDLAIFALPLAVIGARIYYCLFNPVSSFIEVFEIWKGGLAIYGGVIGGFLGVILCCKIKHYSLAQACDLAAPCLILGQAIGRIGCYFAGCCYGVETTIDSMKVFPISVQIDGVWHLSTFFYESFLNLIGFIILLCVVLRSKKIGTTTALYLIYYGTVRCILEQFRDPKECLTILNSSLRVSQILSFVLVIVGVVIIVILSKKVRWVQSHEWIQNNKKRL